MRSILTNSIFNATPIIKLFNTDKLVIYISSTGKITYQKVKKDKL